MARKPWVGESAAHRRLLSALERVAGTDAEILITGESGVGKELYARHAHEHSRRAARPFVAVNCGSIPGELLENELFGHVGGAFTGASSRADGLVGQAEGGTLLLDEVDALAPRNQVKLLRFVQEKEYRRLGEPRLRRADVRIIAATNADLVEATVQGNFREDLLFRLRVVPIHVPPLRERPEDVVPLFEAFAGRYAEEYQLPRPILAPAALERMRAYSWPGNVRELENCVRCLTCLQLTRPAEPGDLPLLDEVRPRATNLVKGDFRRAKAALIDEFEKSYLESALADSDGNIAKAARTAGKPRRAFFELMRKHNITIRRR
jgi:DNA-binding NtrC family response regulator